MANAVNKEIVFNRKKLKPKHYREKSSSAKLIFFLFVIIAIFQFISPGRGGHFRGSRSGGFGGFSGGGGYSGGGGGWSGGGGGFSGGGASGDF
jgi:hypothetical protein